MIDRHVLDSLTALDFLVGGATARCRDRRGPARARARPSCGPDVRCTLLDPVRKKTRFCAHAAMTLGLDNVEIASERLAAHRPPHRYSTVISRAALSIADLVAGARPLLDASGRILAMKGPRPEAEIDPLDRGGLVVRVEPVEASGGASRRDPCPHRPRRLPRWRFGAGGCNNRPTLTLAGSRLANVLVRSSDQ